MHRAENVDIESRLRSIVESLKQLSQKYEMPVICSLHPRTKDKMNRFGLDESEANVQFCAPFGFFDFVQLEQNARCVLSDSGTVQEECCIFHVPNVTLRDVTERPETIECGSNILSGTDGDTIMRAVEIVLSQSGRWETPREYLMEEVSQAVAKILLGYHANAHTIS
jgi:UDP-N-acetylglucosamine 2-epimerase (non-hydrolysing)